MIKLAASSGTVIYEDKNKLYLFKQPARWTTAALFVTGLLAFILLANGLLQLFVFNMPRTSEPLGAILVAAGVLCALIFWRILGYRKKMNLKGLNELKCICIIDLNNNNLLDEHEHILAALADVHLQHAMQFTSSSPLLILAWNKNTLTLVEGNPFSGGIAAVEKVLIAKGIKSRWK